MPMLYELTNMATGGHHLVLDETGAPPPGNLQPVLGAAFFDGTVWTAARATRPGFVRDDFFRDHVFQEGGSWRERAPGIWVHEPRIVTREHAFVPGDIVKQEAHHKWDFFHVLEAHESGGLTVVGDADGRTYGLSAARCKPATLRELVADRDARAAGGWTSTR